MHYLLEHQKKSRRIDRKTQSPELHHLCHGNQSLSLLIFSMETWNKTKEISSWKSSELDPAEFCSLLTCCAEVSTSNRCHSSLTTTCPRKRRTTFTESVDLVDLVEREWPSTWSSQVTSDYSRKSNNSITLKSKTCLLMSLKSINESQAPKKNEMFYY
jgi:hypothetical protein